MTKINFSFSAISSQELKAKQKAELSRLKRENLNQYAIKGTDEDWNSILTSKASKSLISVKSGEKRANLSIDETNNDPFDSDRKKVKKKKRFSK